MSEVTIRGDKELMRKLNKLEPSQMKGALNRIGQLGVGKMTKYPLQPSGSGYVRKKFAGGLASSWDYKSKSKEVKIFSNQSYAPYVQGDQLQAWFHRATGWQRLKETMEKNMPEIVAKLKQEVDKILRTG